MSRRRTRTEKLTNSKTTRRSIWTKIIPNRLQPHNKASKEPRRRIWITILRKRESGRRTRKQSERKTNNNKIVSSLSRHGE